MDILFPKYKVKNNALKLISGTCFNMPIPDIRDANRRLSVVYGRELDLKNTTLKENVRHINIDSFLHDNGIEI